MKPVLLQVALGEHTVLLRSYPAFYTLAWVTAVVLGAVVAARRGLSWRRTLAVYGLALAAGIAGARIFDLGIAGAFYAEDPSRIWSTNFQGFSLYGGLAVASLAGIALARVWHMPVWRLADAAVPGLAVGIVPMRIGCFLRGCCFGETTSVPWGVSFPVGSPAWSHHVAGGQTGVLGIFGHAQPVHPTQLYELAAAILLATLALSIMRRPGAADGIGLLTFALGFTLFRLGNGFYRARQTVITALLTTFPCLKRLAGR